MSGITGFYDIAASQSQAELETSLRQMTGSIRHRGPDEAGAWCNPGAGIALGFRRLFIRDHSAFGSQPMHSGDGRYVIVFDGEIYNRLALREELLGLGHLFQGSADAEVMLAAIRQWGLAGAVTRFNGKFAFALWDAGERRLHLVRDRLGVKPLYYGWVARTLVFGSELKALRAYPAFQAEIDRNALALFLRYGYIPAPESIYRGVHKLTPGCLLTVWPSSEAGDERLEAYWSPRAAVEKGLTSPFRGDESAALEVFESLLTRSVGQRMSADVSVGAFLSGGVDSSTLVALMQKQSRQPVRTFSIGFHEKGLDWAEPARIVARQLGSQHSEWYLTPEEACAVVPRLPVLYDEPFSDYSQIPSFLAAELARRNVTVCLAGEGGDELFGGNARYFQAMRAWELLDHFPLAWRQAAAHGLARLNHQPRGNTIRPGGLFNPGQNLEQVTEMLSAPVREALYLNLISHWQQPGKLVIDGQEPLSALTDPLRWMNTSSFAERMLSLDLVSSLPDGLLTKIDRASMGIGLELRLPFADDHEVVELAWKLPMHMKIRNRQGKWILRQILNRYVPHEMLERRRINYDLPLEAWLRGPLRAWAEELLDEGRLRREGFFHPEPIRQKWLEHLDDRHDWQRCLWDVLMFQAWLAENRG